MSVPIPLDQVPEDLRLHYELYWKKFDGVLIERISVLIAQLAAMTADRNLWQDTHNDDCPNKARADALEAENKQLREVLTIMHEAMDDKKAGAWIKARKWLDERNIYHGDLQENAVLAEVCRTVGSYGAERKGA